MPPDPPVVELKEVTRNTIYLFWTPGFEGDSPITGYYLEYKAVNGKRSNSSVWLLLFTVIQWQVKVCFSGVQHYVKSFFPTASWDYTKTVIDFSPNETDATIIEVNPSTYNIRMFAKNSLGTSKASNVLTITTGETGAVFLNYNCILNSHCLCCMLQYCGTQDKTTLAEIVFFLGF